MNPKQKAKRLLHHKQHPKSEHKQTHIDALDNQQRLESEVKMPDEPGVINLIMSYQTARSNVLRPQYAEHMRQSTIQNLYQRQLSKTTGRALLSEYANHQILFFGIVADLKIAPNGKTARLLLYQPKIQRIDHHQSKDFASYKLFDSHVWIRLDDIQTTFYSNMQPTIRLGETFFGLGYLYEYRGRSNQHRMGIKYGINQITYIHCGMRYHADQNGLVKFIENYPASDYLVKFQHVLPTIDEKAQDDKLHQHFKELQTTLKQRKKRLQYQKRHHRNTLGLEKIIHDTQQEIKNIQQQQQPFAKFHPHTYILKSNTYGNYYDNIEKYNNKNQ